MTNRTEKEKWEEQIRNMFANELIEKRFTEKFIDYIADLIKEKLTEQEARVKEELKKEILKKYADRLCNYDDRNPENTDLMKELNDNRGRSEDCSCDNCFYGRDGIINGILTLSDTNKN